VIASVHGTVAAVGPGGAVVEVGGVGLDVHCTPGTLATLRPGRTARLATSLVVREDSLTLYGFADDDERALFELLQTASGVGPRLAQAVLAVHTPDAVRRAVAAADLAALTRVPGIGRKGAERLVLELKDRIGPADPEEVPADVPHGAEPAWRVQVRQGLVGLGWSAREAEDAVAAVAAEDAVAAVAAEAGDGGASAPDVAALLRQALRRLDRR